VGFVVDTVAVGQIFSEYLLVLGHAAAQLVEALRYNPEVVGSIPDDAIGTFH
jgi:hypothetical protein